MSLQHLPLYAQYLLTHKLTDFAQAQSELCQEYSAPLPWGWEREAGQTEPVPGYSFCKAFLESLATHGGSNIEETSPDGNGRTCDFPFPGAMDASQDAITRGLYVCRKILLRFLPEYAKDAAQLLQVIEDIDSFLLERSMVIDAVRSAVFEEKLQAKTHFIEQVKNTLPGALYIFDVHTFKINYANDKLEGIFGYKAAELNLLGAGTIEAVIHAEDQPVVIKHLQSCLTAKDNEILSCKYRVKHKDGSYKWVRVYESIFRRNSSGQVQEIIAVALDIDREKGMAEQLKHREEQLLEAQEIAKLGSFTWNLSHQGSSGSPQLYKLMEVEPDDFEGFMERVHPDDRARVEGAIQTALQTGLYDCEYRYQGKEGEKVLWSRGRLIYKNGEPVTMTGTVLDITDRVLLLSKATDNERLYKQAEALANMGNWSWKPQTNQLIWTDQLYKIYGLEPQSEELNIERFLSFVHPDDRPAIRESIEKGFTEQLMDYSFRIITAKGEEKTLRSIAQAIRDEEGRLIQVVGTEQDITERQQLIEKLQENEKLYKQAQSIARMGNWSWNVNENKVTWSEELYQIFGLPKEEEISFETFASLLHPEDQENVVAQITESLHTHKPFEFYHRILLKDGTVKTLHGRGEVYTREGAAYQLVGTAQDVTDQVKTSQKIKDQQYFIEQIAEASPTILYLFDVQKNKFPYVNQEVFYVLGYTPEEVLDFSPQTVLDLYHPEDYHLLPERPDSKSKFQYEGSMMQYECRIRHKQGHWCWFLIREVVFKKDENKEVAQVLGAALDINKRKEMERTLVQNSFQLEQSNASLEEFAYVASHDLKEPLRKISTFGDRLMVTQMDRISEDGKIYLKKVIEASQRMQTMIEDLLSVSQISGNRNFERYSLQTVLEEARQALEVKIEQQGAVIESQPLPEVHIVPSLFRQLFQNLLSNSLKFAKAEVPPHVRISYCYKTPDDLEHLSLTKAASYLQLEFKDNGIGFENDYSSKIFQIFQRLHGRSEYEGTGIGLAICKKIVEHHGGVIYASGEPDEGATFTIVLPV